MSKVVEVLPDMQNCSVIRYEAIFRPFETNTWTVEAGVMVLNAQTMIAGNGTGTGYTSLYTTNPSNNWVHRAMIVQSIGALSTTPPNHIRWGELKSDGGYGQPGLSGSIPAGSNMLLVAHQEISGGRSAAIVTKANQIVNTVSPMAIYNRDLDGTADYGPTHNMTSVIYPAMRNVSIAAGAQFRVVSYIVIGNLSDVLVAGRQIVTAPTL